MTMQKLASEIAKLEGKKSQAKIGEVREILKIIVKLAARAQTSDQDPIQTLAIAAKKLFDRETFKLMKAQERKKKGKK